MAGLGLPPCQDFANHTQGLQAQPHPPPPDIDPNDSLGEALELQEEEEHHHQQQQVQLQLLQNDATAAAGTATGTATSSLHAAPEARRRAQHLPQQLPTVLKKLQKWGDYAAFGDVVAPSRFVPCKTPLSEAVLAAWSLPDQPSHRLTVQSLLAAQAAQGRTIGMILDLSNHECLYGHEMPPGVSYCHIKLVAKEVPPPDFVAQVCAAADGFWAARPTDHIAIHCSYGFNRTGFIVACYLIERCGLSVAAALDAFAVARPPGVKHETFRGELLARYAATAAPPTPLIPSSASTSSATDARKLGCLLGVLVGDAAGAVLEFSAVTYPRAQNALRMPGGGVWHVGPGQVTDDGELTLALALALASSAHHATDDGDDDSSSSSSSSRNITKSSTTTNNNNSSASTRTTTATPCFPEERVAAAYAAWAASNPFDMGHTTALAFSAGGPAADMRARAAAGSAGSKANGALMRVAPVALWLGPGASRAAIVAAARADAALSHPHPTCGDANAAYCLALWHLVHNPGDAEGALAAVLAWANETPQGSQQEGGCGCGDEVRGWLMADSAQDVWRMDVAEPGTIGFVKWGFCLAFHFLRGRASFMDALLYTLLAGGDTDTNAAIVCGMMGALHGVHAIPHHMRAAVCEFDAITTGKGHRRPDAATPARALPMLARAGWGWVAAACINGGGARSIVAGGDQHSSRNTRSSQ